jgi:hypothetical protein
MPVSTGPVVQYSNPQCSTIRKRTCIASHARASNWQLLFLHVKSRSRTALGWKTTEKKSIIVFLLLLFTIKKRRCGLRDTRAEEKVCTRFYMQLRCAVDKIARRSDWATQPDDPRSSSCPIMTCGNGSIPNSTN